MPVTTRRQQKLKQQQKSYPPFPLGVIKESTDEEIAAARERWLKLVNQKRLRSPRFEPRVNVFHVRRSTRFPHPPTNQFRHAIYKGKTYAIPIYPEPEPPDYYSESEESG
jgi:hypothetical protein